MRSALSDDPAPPSPLWLIDLFSSQVDFDYVHMLSFFPRLSLISPPTHNGWPLGLIYITFFQAHAALSGQLVHVYCLEADLSLKVLPIFLVYAPVERL